MVQARGQPASPRPGMRVPEPCGGSPRGVVHHAPRGSLHEQGPPLFPSLCSPLCGAIPGGARCRGCGDQSPGFARMGASSQTSVLTWPRCTAPGCVCPRFHQPILENMCAEWRTVQAPRRPPSSSLSSVHGIFQARMLGTKRRSLGPESCLPERDRICAHPAWPIM